MVVKNAVLSVPDHTVDLLEVTDCCNCGTVFAAPKRLLDARRRNGGNFYCSNGHPMVFTETEVDRLRKQLAAARDAELTLKERLRAEGQRAEFWRSATDERDRKLVSARMQIGKLKKRVSAGCCPCCKRHFTNVERHMKTKHPEFAMAGEE